MTARPRPNREESAINPAKRAFAYALAYALGASSLLAFDGNGALAEPVKITIGWSVTPSDLAPLMLAPGVAKYNDVTYTVEPVHFRGTTVQITALQSGALDIASLGSNWFPIRDRRCEADRSQDHRRRGPGHARLGRA